MQDINFVKRGEYGHHIRKFFLYPQFWIDPCKQFTQTGWSFQEFDEVNTSSIPDKKGVYAFVVVPKYNPLFEMRYLFYVGKTNRTLRTRFKEYFKERDTDKYRYMVKEMLLQYKGHLHFYFLELKTEIEVNTIEEILLNTMVPFVNTDIPEAQIDPNLKNIYKSF